MQVTMSLIIQSLFIHDSQSAVRPSFLFSISARLLIYISKNSKACFRSAAVFTFLQRSFKTRQNKITPLFLTSAKSVNLFLLIDITIHSVLQLILGHNFHFLICAGFFYGPFFEIILLNEKSDLLRYITMVQFKYFMKGGGGTYIGIFPI